MDKIPNGAWIAAAILIVGGAWLYLTEIAPVGAAEEADLAVSATGAQARLKSARRPPGLQEQINKGREFCEEASGQFSMDDEAITRVDLNGDGDLDWVLDETFFKCTRGSPYYGNMGPSAWFYVGDTEYIGSPDWTLVEVPTAIGERVPVIVMSTVGGACGSTKFNYCFEAVVWDHKDDHWHWVGLEDHYQPW